MTEFGRTIISGLFYISNDAVILYSIVIFLNKFDKDHPTWQDLSSKKLHWVSYSSYVSLMVNNSMMLILYNDLGKFLKGKNIKLIYSFLLWGHINTYTRCWDQLCFQKSYFKTMIQLQIKQYVTLSPSAMNWLQHLGSAQG